MLQTVAALLALLAQDPPSADPPRPQAPPPLAASAAAEELAELLRACKEAEGVEAVIRMVGELPQEAGDAGAETDPFLVADILISLRFARPCQGRLDMKGKMLDPSQQGEEGSPVYLQVDRSLIGNGEGLFLVEHQQRRCRRVANAVTELGDDWPGLLPLQVWAGIPPVAELQVTALPDPPQQGWRGFTVEQPWMRREYWFDAQGVFRRAAQHPSAELQELLAEQGQPRIPAYRMEIRSWKLHAEVRAADFLCQLPQGLAEDEESDPTRADDAPGGLR